MMERNSAQGFNANVLISLCVFILLTKDAENSYAALQQCCAAALILKTE